MTERFHTRLHTKLRNAARRWLGFPALSQDDFDHADQTGGFVVRWVPLNFNVKDVDRDDDTLKEIRTHILDGITPTDSESDDSNGPRDRTDRPPSGSDLC